MQLKVKVMLAKYIVISCLVIFVLFGCSKYELKDLANSRLSNEAKASCAKIRKVQTIWQQSFRALYARWTTNDLILSNQNGEKELGIFSLLAKQDLGNRFRVSLNQKDKLEFDYCGKFKILSVVGSVVSIEISSTLSVVTTSRNGLVIGGVAEQREFQSVHLNENTLTMDLLSNKASLLDLFSKDEVFEALKKSELYRVYRESNSLKAEPINLNQLIKALQEIIMEDPSDSVSYYFVPDNLLEDFAIHDFDGRYAKVLISLPHLSDKTMRTMLVPLRIRVGDERKDEFNKAKSHVSGFLGADSEEISKGFYSTVAFDRLSELGISP